MIFKYTIKKTFHIGMGHILEDAYTKKCCNLHGHTYTVDIELGGERLNKDGMLVDYTYIKEVFKRRIEDTFDHATMVPPKWQERLKDIPGVVNVEFNPTAENIAEFFFHLLEEDFSKDNYELISVSVKETDTNFACYKPY